MPPSLASNDGPDRSLRNTVQAGEFGLPSATRVTGKDALYSRIVKLGAMVLLPVRPKKVHDGMGFIFGGRHPLKVASKVVRGVPILMIDVGGVERVGHKSERHKAMDSKRFAEATLGAGDTKPNHSPAAYIKSLERAPAKRALPGDTTPDVSKVAYLVVSGETGDREGGPKLDCGVHNK